MTDDFTKLPQSLGAVRAKRAGSGREWTPRECLIEVLRLIDAGEANPDTIVVAWRETSNGVGVDPRMRFFQSTPDPLISLGLLSQTSFIMQMQSTNAAD
jgi:hypothetical protein